jgi:hypothetical protein
MVLPSILVGQPAVRHKVTRALAERGAVRIAIYEDLQDLRESNARAARRLDDRGIGPSGRKLRIAGVQLSDPAGEALFPHISGSRAVFDVLPFVNRHQLVVSSCIHWISSRKLAAGPARSPRDSVLDHSFRH